MAVLLIAAHGCGNLFARLGQPPAIGEIVGGILLGPTALAAISPGVAPAKRCAGRRQKC